MRTGKRDIRMAGAIAAAEWMSGPATEAPGLAEQCARW